MLLTLTFVTGVPAAFGATVPVTVTFAVPFWIKLRAGEVMVSTGGSGIGAASLLQPANTNDANDVTKRRFRMADDPFSKGPAKPDNAAGPRELLMDQAG
jgi:alpha-D-ribose 1-methylphosphonate 5-triphosphate synthase subunit PhnL